MYRITLLGMVAGMTLLGASTLSVYQDKTHYRYHPEDRFIGLTQGVQATCNGEDMVLRRSSACPSEKRLCRLFEEEKVLERKIIANSANSRILSQLITLPQPQSIDAESWIGAAQKLANEETRLQLQKRELADTQQRLKEIFAKQTRSHDPLETTEVCQGTLELSLPYGYVTFANEYTATLKKETITVTQQLAVTNKSGVDIEAKRARFYYRPARSYIRPIHFSPWTVSEHKNYPMTKKIANVAMKRTMRMPAAQTAEDTAMVAPDPVATYNDAREYTVKGLRLPSTGEAVHVPVLQWEVPLLCEERVYPYRNSSVFEVCSFTPKFQIEQNRWKITDAKGRIVNENGVGEYEKEIYRLYTKHDPDIKVMRKKIVRNERETWLFGNTVRKKDGFVLTLVNKSDRSKALKVIERIPVSTTEKIKVKLLGVEGKGVTYKTDKEGKVEMDVTLNAHESKKIEVLFEISYDKDLKITY